MDEKDLIDLKADLQKKINIPIAYHQNQTKSVSAKIQYKGQKCHCFYFSFFLFSASINEKALSKFMLIEKSIQEKITPYTYQNNRPRIHTFLQWKYILEEDIEGYIEVEEDRIKKEYTIKVWKK